MLIISFLESIKQSINHSNIHPFSHSFYFLHYKFYITDALQTMRTTMPLLALILQLLLFATSCKQSTEPPIIPPDEGVANTIVLSVEWTDLYRINVKWNRAVMLQMEMEFPKFV